MSDRTSKSIPNHVLAWFGQFHMWDFIYSDVAEGKANWRTNKRHPLNARTLYERWKRSDQLVGVRFSTKSAAKTSYLLLDIDRGSQYHPSNDELGLREILTALESIGLCRYMMICSSQSGGIHIYFPLPESLLCTALAKTIRHTLEMHRFEIRPGKLEIFPNIRAEPGTNYQGHRLPLQIDSYVLNEDCHPVHNSLERFIQSWNDTACAQDLDCLKNVLEKHKEKKRATSQVIEEWKLRLESTLKQGWTDHGQTNQILPELCTYGRVFLDLSWDEVEQWALKRVVTLSGYEKYCRHTHEIRRRINEWVECNHKNNKYHPIGSQAKPKTSKAPTNNEKSKDALTRIQLAIDELRQELGELPQKVKQRQDLIVERAHCSPSTLYRHKPLWHPEYNSKGSVNLDSKRITPVLDRANLPKATSKTSVSPYLVRDSEICQSNSKNVNTAETRSNQTITHVSLLSVGSVQKIEQPLKKRDIFETQQKFQPNDIVRWRRYDSTFRVRKVTNDGMVWAKHLNTFVPLVDAVLHRDELEVIESRCSS